MSNEEYSHSSLITHHSCMDILWLGYSGLTISYTDVVAVLIYGAPLDGLLLRSYGCVPPGVQAVVLTAGGEYLPTRLNPHQLRQRWAGWRNRAYEDT